MTDDDNGRANRGGRTRDAAYLNYSVRQLRLPRNKPLSLPLCSTGRLSNVSIFFSARGLATQRPTLAWK